MHTTDKPLVSLFAGASTPDDPMIMEAASQLGAALGAAGFGVVYGGGTWGVMGDVAKSALDAGGRVIAIALKKYAHEGQWPGVSSVEYAETEQERFARFLSIKPVACLALPGGPGTLRETAQAVEAAVYDGGPPVFLVQAGNYLDGIKDYFDRAVKTGLIKPEHRDKVKLLPVSQIADSLSALIKPGR